MYVWDWIADLRGHIQNTRHQYNMPAFENRIDRAVNREGLAERFEDPMVAASIKIDSSLLNSLHQQILLVERQIAEQARDHDRVAVQLLRTIPGIGKRVSGRNNKIGNAHLKWASSQAASLHLRESEQAKAWHQKLASRYR